MPNAHATSSQNSFEGVTALGDILQTDIVVFEKWHPDVKGINSIY